MDIKKKRSLLLVCVIITILFAVSLLIYCIFVVNKNIKNPLLESKIDVPDGAETIRIVADIDYAPFSFYDSIGNVTGHDVDIAFEIANRLGKKADITCMNWRQALKTMELGNADLILGYDSSDYCDYPYLEATMPICNDSYSLWGKEPILSIDEVKEKTIAAVYDTCSESLFDDYNITNENVIYFLNISSAFASIIEGNCDYVLTRDSVANELCKRYKVADSIKNQYVITSSRISFATNVNNHKLANDVNRIILEMVQEDRIEYFNKKWLINPYKNMSVFEAIKQEQGIFVIIGFVILAISVLFYVLHLEQKHLRDIAFSLQKEKAFKDAICEGAYGYFTANLSKDELMSPVFERIEGVFTDVTKEFNLSKNSFSELQDNFCKNRILTNKEEFQLKGSKEALIEDFNNQKFVEEINYWSYTPSGKQLCHMETFYLSQEEKSKDIFAICVVRDYTKQEMDEEKKRMQDAVLKGISADFDSVSYTDLRTGQSKLYFISPFFTEQIGYRADLKFFRDRMENICDNYVAPSEIERFKKEMDLDFIKEHLESDKSYFFRTSLVFGEEKLFYEFKFLIDHNSNGNGFIMGIHNVDEEIRHELEVKKNQDLNNDVIQILASEYSSVYYVDVETQEYKICVVSEELKPMYEKGLKDTRTYTEALEAYMNHFIFEDDIPKMTPYLSLDYVKEQLSKQKSFTLLFRIVTNGDVHFCQAKYVKIDDDLEPPTKIAVGLTDDDNIISRLFISERMYDEYDSVYICDLEKDTFKTFKSSMEEEFLPEKEGSYSKAMRKFAYQLRTENFEIWLRMSNPKYMQLYMNKDDRREFLYRMPNEVASWRRCIIQVIERRQGVPIQIIAGFMGIDSARAEMLELSLQMEEQKKNLEARQALLEEARSNAESESIAKSNFLFNMSHDIRTPMNAIHGFTEIAKKNIKNPEKLSDCLDKIEMSGNHLLSLINDVLDMARIESGKVVLEEKEYNIRKETNDIVTIVRETAEENGLNLDLVIKGIRNEDVFADTLRLNQIFLNILGNAIKYTKAGGRISFTVSQKPSEAPEYGTYEFVVEDNGIGMSKEFLEHIFDAFTREKNTTKSGVQGTGLGMAITKSLVDLMGGDIQIESAPGLGTKVTIIIQFRIMDASYKELLKKEKEITIDLEGCRILLVEDNEFNREIARDILEEEGIIVEEATDGSVAVDILSKAQPDYYSFILMDVQMPIMDGYTATGKIRQLPNKEIAGLPIIAMTANAFEEDKTLAMTAGMDAFIPKPVNIKQLLETLQSFKDRK